jgi:serine/threonine protein kinase
MLRGSERILLGDAAPPAAARRGDVIGNTYRVLELLGSGGMGEVYEAEHTRLARRFAIKFLRRDLAHDRDTAARFSQEGRAMAVLRSDHVVSIVDCGETADGAPFFVMERLYGEDLRQMLARHGTLTVPRAIGIIIDVCRGLCAVHAADLVHRDLKPANLFITRRDDGVDLCKLLDFGVVRRVSSATTKKGSFIGTVRYMAPEQLSESGVIDTRTDLYALGAILYECLVGHPPFKDDAIERVLYAIMHEAPRALPGALPRELDTVVMRALARDPKERFQRAEDLLETLLPFAAAPTARSHTRAPSNPTTERIPAATARSSTVRRRRWVWLVPSTALSALILAKVGSTPPLERAAHTSEDSVASKGPPSAAPATASVSVVGGAPSAVGSRAPTPRSVLPPGASIVPPTVPERPELQGERRPRPAGSAKQTSTIGATFDAVSPYSVEPRPSR